MEKDTVRKIFNYIKSGIAEVRILFHTATCHLQIKGPADRTLIYLIFYITECLRKLQKSPNKIAGQKDLAALALSHQLPIPGENGFPLNSMYKAPQSKPDEDELRAYLQQARQELGARLCDLAFPEPQERPSKWWLCFARRRFMDKGLVGQGVVL